MVAVHRQLVGEPTFRYRAYETFLKAEFAARNSSHAIQQPETAPKIALSRIVTADVEKQR